MMRKQRIDIELAIINGLIAGDQTSYKSLFDRYYQWLCNYLYKLSNDSSLAEDLVQNVFLKIWEKRDSLQINTSLKNYLFKSCHNEFLMHLRKQKKEYDTLDVIKMEVLLEMNSEEAENELEQKWVDLEKSIDKLPKKCKEVFKLSRFDQKKHKEIASILGISTKTVEVHISKALRFLKTNISSFF